MKLLPGAGEGKIQKVFFIITLKIFKNTHQVQRTVTTTIQYNNCTLCTTNTLVKYLKDVSKKQKINGKMAKFNSSQNRLFAFTVEQSLSTTTTPHRNSTSQCVQATHT